MPSAGVAKHGLLRLKHVNDPHCVRPGSSVILIRRSCYVQVHKPRLNSPPAACTAGAVLL